VTRLRIKKVFWSELGRWWVNVEEIYKILCRIWYVCRGQVILDGIGGGRDDLA